MTNENIYKRLLEICRRELPTFKLSLLYRIFLLGVIGYEKIIHEKLLQFEFVIWR